MVNDNGINKCVVCVKAERVSKVSGFVAVFDAQKQLILDALDAMEALDVLDIQQMNVQNRIILDAYRSIQDYIEN